MKFKGILSTAPTTYSDNDDDKSAALLGGLLGPGLDGPNRSYVETLGAAGAGSAPNGALWNIESQAIPHGPSAPALEMTSSLTTLHDGNIRESLSNVEPSATATTASACYSALARCACCVQNTTARIRANPLHYLWLCVKEPCKYAIHGAVALAFEEIGRTRTQEELTGRMCAEAASKGIQLMDYS